MNRVFGKRKDEPRPTLNDAIQTIEGRNESLEKKISCLESELKKIRGQISHLRDGASKDLLKQKALRILKQKKMYEEQQGQLHQQMFNMDQTNFSIQGMKDNWVNYKAMKDGLKVMQNEYKKLDIDKIEKLQDEMFDMITMNNEINEAFASSYDMPDVDESELEAELAALGDELDLGETDTSYMDEALKAPVVPQNPNMPVAEKNAEGIEVDDFGLPKVPNALFN